MQIIYIYICTYVYAKDHDNRPCCKEDEKQPRVFLATQGREYFCLSVCMCPFLLVDAPVLGSWPVILSINERHKPRNQRHA